MKSNARKSVLRAIDPDGDFSQLHCETQGAQIGMKFSHSGGHNSEFIQNSDDLAAVRFRHYEVIHRSEFVFNEALGNTVSSEGFCQVVWEPRGEPGCWRQWSETWQKRRLAYKESKLRSPEKWFGKPIAQFRRRIFNRRVNRLPHSIQQLLGGFN